MMIDVDRCTGCGACMVACAVENNVPPAAPEANERTGITWMRVYKISNGAAVPATAARPSCPCCASSAGTRRRACRVCPQNAVDVDPATGIVGQMPERCLGCRYCMAACPYHARYFNWWDPVWPAGMEKTLNPDVAPRMRGVVEKCNFCHGRLHAAQAQGRRRRARREIEPADYVPACVEACPAKAITFGDLNDDASPKRPGCARSGEAFRLLEKLGTDPKIYYRSARALGAPGGRGSHGGARKGAGTWISNSSLAA